MFGGVLSLTRVFKSNLLLQFLAQFSAQVKDFGLSETAIVATFVCDVKDHEVPEFKTLVRV